MAPETSLTLAQWVEQLKLVGVRFTFVDPVPCRGQEMALDGALLPEFVSDPAAVAARLYGVTKEQYIGWVASERTVQCAGKTKRGKACRKSVAGGSLVEPKRWADLEGGYCSAHGG
jgi:hypothetical protein